MIVGNSERRGRIGASKVPVSSPLKDWRGTAISNRSARCNMEAGSKTKYERSLSSDFQFCLVLSGAAGAGTSQPNDSPGNCNGAGEQRATECSASRF